MSGFNHNDFLSRLSEASDGRDLWPWLHSLGLTSGVVQGMVNRGVVPSGYSLLALQCLENVNVSWLLTGTGKPYLVERPADDRGCRARVAEALRSAQWTATIATDGLHNAIVLARESRFVVKDKPPRLYTELRIFAHAGPESLAAVIEGAAGVRFLPLGEADMQALVQGRLGSYRIMGDANTPGLLARAKPIKEERMNAIAEHAARYLACPKGSELAPDEAALLEVYRRLPVADRSRLQTIATALAAAIDVLAEDD